MGGPLVGSVELIQYEGFAFPILKIRRLGLESLSGDIWSVWCCSFPYPMPLWVATCALLTCT